MPKVDIIIPAYNAARYLPAALRSVLAQTFSDWRILLVDDGSTDNTLEVAQEFAEQCGSKLKLISQENRGLSGARNAALRYASADFIALLDSDDIWLPTRLERSLAAFARMPEAGLSYGSISYVDQEDNIGGTPTLETQNSEGWIARGIYTRALNLPCPTITFRKNCIESVGLFDEMLKSAEDRDLWLRIAMQYQAVRIPEVIALYRISAGSMSTNPDRMFQSQRIFIEKHAGSPGCDAHSRRIALSSSYRELAETLAVRGRKGQAMIRILKAVWFQPWAKRNWRITAAILLNSVQRGQR